MFRPGISQRASVAIGWPTLSGAQRSGSQRLTRYSLRGPASAPGKDQERDRAAGGNAGAGGAAAAPPLTGRRDLLDRHEAVAAGAGVEGTDPAVGGPEVADEFTRDGVEQPEAAAIGQDRRQPLADGRDGGPSRERPRPAAVASGRGGVGVCRARGAEAGPGQELPALNVPEAQLLAVLVDRRQPGPIGGKDEPPGRSGGEPGTGLDVASLRNSTAESRSLRVRAGSGPSSAACLSRPRPCTRRFGRFEWRTTSARDESSSRNVPL